MDYSMQQHTDPSGWMYSQQDSPLRTNSNEPLQEPVPFEDFQFSFGLEPGFAMPVPLDMPPAPPSLNDSNNFLPLEYQQSNSHDLTTLTNNNPLLDENDQKAFSQFLDAFFVDKDGQMSNAEQMANQFSTMYDAPPPPLVLNDGYGTNAHPPPTSETDPYHVATSMFLPKQTPISATGPSATQHRNQDDEDEYRRSSILQSLDQQKQFHQRLNRVTSVQQQQQQQQLGKGMTPPNNTNHYQEAIGPDAIFLQQSSQVAAPFITKHHSTTSQKYHPQQHAPYPPPERHHPTSTSATNSNSNARERHPRSTSSSSTSPWAAPTPTTPTPTTTRRNKSNKELLTEEEKRNNHIASEQKRRSTIRNGFKDLTDIVPTLKNINNSKSTVLFKAVDYIKYLEKRNKNLREKMGSLEVRVKVEGRVSDILMHSSSLQQKQKQSVTTLATSSQSSPPTSQPGSRSPPPTAKGENEHNERTQYHHLQQQQLHHHQQQQPQQQQQHQQNDIASNNSGGGGVAAALLAHKSQQKQLMALQEQLQYHQRLLTQQDESKRHAHPPISSYRQTQQQQQHQQHYHSISSSSTSSSTHSSPQSSDLYQHPPVPAPRWTYDPNSRSGNTSNVKMEVDNEEPLKVSA